MLPVRLTAFMLVTECIKWCVAVPNFVIQVNLPKGLASRTMRTSTDMGLTLVDDFGTEFNENRHRSDKHDLQPVRR